MKILTHNLYVIKWYVYLNLSIVTKDTLKTFINEKTFSLELEMLRQIISHIINVEFEIVSLQEDKTTCSITCKKTDGRMAFLHEG